MASGIFSPRNRQKTTEERMKEMEERAKLNRGGYTAIGEETGTNIPFMMPGQRMLNPFGDTAGAQLARVQFPNSEELTQDDLNTDLPELQMPEMGQGPVSAEDFINYFTQQYFAPDMSQGIASTPDGGILYRDGSIHYTDGTVRQGGTGDANAYPIASMPDGSVKYSDGSIRSFGQSGLSGLQQGIFGQELPITQDYGNYNPGMGYARNTHGGVDLRTRNLAGEQRDFRLPVDTQVVEVIRAESGSPYGNSVLLQLPSGEMLRFSHLSQIGNFNPGDTLVAGQAFGSPGSTGNSTAEHLDLEYYDPSGRRVDPNQFLGFTKEIQPPQQQGQILGATQEQQPQPEPQRTVETSQPVSQFMQPIENAAGQIRDRIDTTNPAVIQPNPTGSKAISTANVIDLANPTGKFGVGITENLRGDTQGARQEQLQSIRSFAPGSASRSEQQQTDPFRQLIGDAIDTLGTRMKELGVPVLNKNISEKIAGGMTRFTPQAYAADTQLPTPGKGIDELKNLPRQMMSPARPNMSDIASSKVVGDVAGGDMSMSNMSLPADSAQMQSKMQGYDARDPFFRQGLNEKFASDINQDKAQSGALTIDLFKPGFYQTPDKINTAFGGTSLFGQAQGKYNEAVEELKRQYMSMFGGADYDQGDVQRILSSIPKGADLTKLQLNAPARASYDFGNSSGSGSYNNPPSPGSSATVAPNQQQQQFARLSQLASQVKNPGPSPAESRGFQLSAPQPAASSASINRQAQQPQQSLFSRIGSAISNLFRRK